MPVPLTTLEELISRYDIARTYANHGSYDNWFMEKFKLTQIKKLKPFEKLHQKTYTVPFARNLFEKEIRYDLVEIRNHYRMLSKRNGTNDIESSQAITKINKVLEEIPSLPKKNLMSWLIGTKEILGMIIGLPIFTTIMALGEQYLPIIVLVGVMSLPIICQLSMDRAFVYFAKKLWYRTVTKRLGISELKKRLIRELVDANDSSFV